MSVSHSQLYVTLSYETTFYTAIYQVPFYNLNLLYAPVSLIYCAIDILLFFKKFVISFPIHKTIWFCWVILDGRCGLKELFLCGIVSMFSQAQLINNKLKKYSVPTFDTKLLVLVFLVFFHLLWNRSVTFVLFPNFWNSSGI